MKTLTIRQPWASLIAAGVKTIETRSWSTRYRGPLAIHAGRATPDGLWETGDWAIAWEGNPRNAFAYRHILSNRLDLPLGAVVATCTLADVVPILTVGDAVDGQAHVVQSRQRPDRTYLYRPSVGHHSTGGEVFDHFEWDPTEVTDQLPFGDFTPGRYAWLLTDITPCDPVPAKGRQGLWDWDSGELDRA